MAEAIPSVKIKKVEGAGIFVYWEEKVWWILKKGASFGKTGVNERQGGNRGRFFVLESPLLGLLLTRQNNWGFFLVIHERLENPSRVQVNLLATTCISCQSLRNLSAIMVRQLDETALSTYP